MKKFNLSYLMLLVAIFIMLHTPNISLAQDPIKVSPHTYEVLLDNERVRVMEYSSKPGDISPMHSFSEVVIYRLSPSYKIKLTFPDGSTEVIEGKVGEVRWDKGLREIENVGNTEARALIVELKQPQQKLEQ